MSDAPRDREGLELWVADGLAWADASQQFVSCSDRLALTSRELADTLELAGGEVEIADGTRSVLVEQLRALAGVVEGDATTQRDQTLAVASAMADLRLVGD